MGPPGTGKTTTLLNEVDRYLKQTDPDKIGYFSFTQKAAYHARDRAMSKFNLSEDDFVVTDGERIAQMIVAPCTKVQWLDVEELSITERGDGGFGSTGKN